MQRIGDCIDTGKLGNGITRDRLGHPETSQQEQDPSQETGDSRTHSGTLTYSAVTLDHQPGRALSQNHHQADNTGQQTKGVEQAEEVAFIGRAQILIHGEGHPLQQVAKGYAKDHRRHKTTDEEAPVPGRAPAGIFNLGAVIKTDRTEEKGHQGQHHGGIKTGEGRGINRRPGCKDGTTGSDQPHLITIPVGGNGVDHHTPFIVGATKDREQSSHSHVKTIGHGKANQQHADERPPNHA